MPKYIACADLHISSSRPRYRIDNYENTCCEKLKWIVNIANLEFARILIAGDIFDHTRISWELFNKVTDIIQLADQKPYVVHGQHDILNHAENLDCSPLMALHKAGCIHLLDGDYICNQGTYIYGAGFERDIPQVKHKGTNIVLMHKCITEGVPPFYLPDALSSKEVLRRCTQFDLIVSGDFHQAFQATMGERKLLNCGPMMRKSKDQQELKPQVFFIDTTKRIYNPIQIPVQPPEKVFDLDRIEREIENGVTVDTTALQKLFKESTEALDFKVVVEKVRTETEKFQYITYEEVQNLFEENECPS